MNGQWIGPFSGTNNGLLVLDLDDAGDHYEGSASVLDQNAQLPPLFADFSMAPIPKGEAEFDLTVPIRPIDRRDYPADVAVPDHAITHWKRAGDSIHLSWRTPVGTFGNGIVEKSKACQHSELARLSNIETWDDFRKYSLNLEPYRYIFRGQASNKWRLRTSFHRTGRSSLIKYMMQDIPVLHHHLSGLMAQSLDLRDSLQYAAFYNLLQHHGYPTPLLDWTYSPFIAAYFAFKRVPRSEIKPEDRVRLFVFDKLHWCKDFRPIPLVAPPALHFTVLEPLALHNPRVMPQQSVSSVTNVDDIESYLMGREKEASKRYLRAIDIPASERDNVMKELGVMGITAGSLFPGIDGVCEQVRERFFTA